MVDLVRVRAGALRALDPFGKHAIPMDQRLVLARQRPTSVLSMATKMLGGSATKWVLSRLSYLMEHMEATRYRDSVNPLTIAVRKLMMEIYLLKPRENQQV